MAQIIREVLNNAGMVLPLYTGGQSKVGFGITGTWVGTIVFEWSADGVRWLPLAVDTFPFSTPVVASVTANGNYEAVVQNAVAVRVRLSALTSGSPIISIATSIDSTYQDAFLAATSRYVTQKVASGGANVITIAAQANRAWRLKTLSVGFSVVSGAAVDLQISDGASSLLWEGYVPLGAGVQASGGGAYLVPIPPPVDLPGYVSGGIVNTPGNSLVITLAAPGGSVTSTMNAEIVSA